MGKPISLRAFARRRGVSAEAVSKAVSDGRLTLPRRGSPLMLISLANFSISQRMSRGLSYPSPPPRSSSVYAGDAASRLLTVDMRREF